MVEGTDAFDGWFRKRTDRRNRIPVKAHEVSEYLRTPKDVTAALEGFSVIARRADVDRLALSRGLSGNRDPRLGTVTKIAAACGVGLRFVQRGSTS